MFELLSHFCLRPKILAFARRQMCTPTSQTAEPDPASLLTQPQLMAKTPDEDKPVTSQGISLSSTYSPFALHFLVEWFERNLSGEFRYVERDITEEDGFVVPTFWRWHTTKGGNHGFGRGQSIDGHQSRRCHSVWEIPTVGQSFAHILCALLRHDLGRCDGENCAGRAAAQRPGTTDHINGH